MKKFISFEVVIVGYSIPIIVALGTTKNPAVLFGYLAMLGTFAFYLLGVDYVQAGTEANRMIASSFVNLLFGMIITIAVCVFNSPAVILLTVIMMFVSWIVFSMTDFFWIK